MMTDLVSAFRTFWMPSTYLYIRTVVCCIPVPFSSVCGSILHAKPWSQSVYERFNSNFFLCVRLIVLKIFWIIAFYVSLRSNYLDNVFSFEPHGIQAEWVDNVRWLVIVTSSCLYTVFLVCLFFLSFFQSQTSAIVLLTHCVFVKVVLWRAVFVCPSVRLSTSPEFKCFDICTTTHAWDIGCLTSSRVQAGEQWDRGWGGLPRSTSQSSFCSFLWHPGPHTHTSSGPP